MRPPRYRFPDEVRTTTRAMATRMVTESTVVETPADLEAWLVANPRDKQSLEKGGFESEFNAADLLPLLHVMIQNAGGPPPRPTIDPPPPAAKSFWPVIAVALLIVIVIGVAALILL